MEDTVSEGPCTKSFASLHFRWGELLATQHRDPEILAAQASPPDEVRINLCRLAVSLLEPARDIVGPLVVTSGYRCPALNRAVGGSGTRPGTKPSAHMDGRAADVHPRNMGLVDAFEALAGAGGLWALDKLILEALGPRGWLHLQVARRGARPARALLMTFDGASYPAFDPSDPRVLALRAS